ncbi:hypothetical protein [Mesorhizobium koreense]|jgi:hypothetical protein|uniref:hypothetical protein n=1 Tax=Mesorhizobium koreense TaxID=3074855 RepID=UPI00287B775B|nr:hypothetical protein [Mesorhizobium sp. WR6]
MSDEASEVVEILQRIEALLKLLAEDKIAERDARQRMALLEIVGSSSTKQKSVLLMNGTRTQTEIHGETSVNKGHLSTLVGKLHQAKLLIGDPKKPKLAISIPSNFFESYAESK